VANLSMFAIFNESRTLNIFPVNPKTFLTLKAVKATGMFTKKFCTNNLFFLVFEHIIS